MAQCPTCHAQLDEEATVCVRCGADVSWWLSRDSEVYGPYSLATVRFILADKRARMEDAAMIGSHGRWGTLGELLGADGQPVTVRPQAARPQLLTTRHQKERPNYRSLSKRGWVVFTVACIFIAVGGIAVIIWPAYNVSYGEHATRNVSADLEMIGVALEMYVRQHDGVLPEQGKWAEAIQSYIGDEAAYMPYVGPDTEGYEIPAGIAGAKPAMWAKPESVVILSQDDGPPETRLKLYGDWMVRPVAATGTGNTRASEDG